MGVSDEGNVAFTMAETREAISLQSFTGKPLPISPFTINKRHRINI